MTDWQLQFRESRRFTYADCETALSKALHGPVRVELGQLQITGDPRDGGARPVTFTVEVDRHLQVVMTLDENMRFIGDEGTFSRITGVTLKDAGSAASTKLDVWRRLRERLAEIGCTDETLASNLAPIVDELEGLGDTRTAAQLRKDARAALIELARATTWPHVILSSPRVDDIEAVLAAYPEPTKIESVTLNDCQRTTLPAGFTRFPNIKELTITERGLDASALRGVSLPKLKTLFLTDSGVTRITRQDVAGFPRLRQMFLQDNPLAELDPDIIDVCPKLRRVLVVRTPLARKATQMAALKARWKNVSWVPAKSGDDEVDGEDEPDVSVQATAEPPPAERLAGSPPESAPSPVAAGAPVVPASIEAKRRTKSAAQRPLELIADELRPYYDAILAAPDDDAPRLELARILTERGDRRGEHIRLSCELDKLDREDPARAALEARCKELPSLWWFVRPPELDRVPVSLGHRRGLIDEIECSIAHFVAYSEAIMKQAPIRVYDANPAPEGHGPALAACPSLAKLRGLQLHYVKDDDVAAILASPYLANLRELEIGRPLDGEAAVATLAAALRGLTGLRVLSLYYNTVDLSACEALAKLADDMKLELLDVRSVNLPAAGLAILRARLGVDRVMPAPEPRVYFKFGVLDFARGSLGAKEVLALIDSGEYRNAVSLNVGTSIGDAGIAHIARSGAFPKLKTLSLGGTGITDAGALAIANDAVGFDHLEELWLGDVPAEGDSIGATDASGVSDRAVEALARSTRLPALRTIGRSKEYRRIYDERSREGKEVVPIQRTDGRVVESILYHSIWP